MSGLGKSGTSSTRLATSSASFSAVTPPPLSTGGRRDRGEGAYCRRSAALGAAAGPVAAAGTAAAVGVALGGRARARPRSRGSQRRHLIVRPRLLRRSGGAGRTLTLGARCHVARAGGGPAG